MLLCLVSYLKFSYPIECKLFDFLCSCQNKLLGEILVDSIAMLCFHFSLYCNGIRKEDTDEFLKEAFPEIKQIKRES